MSLSSASRRLSTTLGHLGASTTTTIPRRLYSSRSSVFVVNAHQIQVKPELPPREVTVITMSNKVNAMNQTFFDELLDTLDHIEKNYPPTPVLFTSSHPRVFSAGLDLNYIMSLDRTQFAEFTQLLDRAFSRVFTFPRPTMALVNGNAVAGGAVLASCCDWRVAVRDPPGTSPASQYCLREIALGLPFPALVLELLRYALPTRTFWEGCLTARSYSTEEAKEHGIYDTLIDHPTAGGPADPVAHACKLMVENYFAVPESMDAYCFTKASIQRPFTTEFMSRRDVSERHVNAFVNARFGPAEPVIQRLLAQIKSKK